jgi:hypothetical protein
MVISPEKLCLQVSGVPTAVAERIRLTLADDFGNPLKVTQSQEPVPCRHCLQLTRPGEDVILFAYCPFETSGPYAEVGPVFIHARACTAYECPESLPADFSGRQRLFRAYNKAGEIVDARPAEPAKHMEVVQDLFADREVSYIHSRSPTYGCFTYRVQRAME